MIAEYFPVLEHALLLLVPLAKRRRIFRFEEIVCNSDAVPASRHRSGGVQLPCATVNPHALFSLPLRSRA